LKITPVQSWPKWLKLTLLSVLGLMQVLVMIPAIVVAYANVAPVWVSRGLIYEETEEVPEFKVALILGTTDRIGGRENLYFRYRIDAAEELWKSGKVQTLIVSGDNRTKYYNEPAKMRDALIERGIPADRIVCDYAGLRTLDSVVRAKRIFGTERVLFVSQPFHIRRAIYLAQANGIEAHGFAAKDVKTAAGFRTRVREVGARVKMWLDVHYLKTQPRHLGDREKMPK
jgi:SanA protein